MTIWRILCAALLGLCVSSFLLWSSYATRGEVLFWPQAAGFWMCWLTRGIHKATKIDYWTIAMPANAALYAVLVLVVRGIASKRHSRDAQQLKSPQQGF